MIKMTLPLAACLAAMPAIAQCPAQRLTQPSDLTDSFGSHAIEIEGDHLIIADAGAYTACSIPDPFRCSGGALFAYRWDGQQWAFVQQVVPPDVGVFDGFGSDLDLDGDRMLVVTPKRDFDGTMGYFHEYLYDADTQQWVESRRTLGPGVAVESFGLSRITADGSLALLGQGPVIHRYTQGSEGWEYRDSFEAPDEPGQTFGQTIKLEGDWAFVTAWTDESASPGLRHGSVYAFRREADDSLRFVQKLLPPDVGDGTRQFGISTDFDGRTLAVADPGGISAGGEQDGVVYLYEFDGDQWTLRQTLTHSDAGRPWYPDGFGRAVSIDDDTLIASTSESLDFNFAYVFRRQHDGQWREVAVLDPSVTVPDLGQRGFGVQTAVQGDRALVGSEDFVFGIPPEPPQAAAYAFDLACEICLPDLDLDGALTIFDFLTFLNLFEDGDAQADFDGDGELTLFDFLAFQTAFDAGC